MALLCLTGSLAAKVIHVNTTAATGGNGTSWPTAFRHLQDALNQSVAGDQVWMAAGTYYPDDGSTITPGDRTATFSIKNGVALIGGFAGTETAVGQRVPGSDPTILSGEIWADSLYWSLHVVTPLGPATLDGITVTKGNANGETQPFNRGAGIFATSTTAALTLRNCTFVANRANDSGGAIYSNAAVNAINCTITGNQAKFDGGAIHCATITASDSSFTGNSTTANASGGNGGAIYTLPSNLPLHANLTNCIFTENTASGTSSNGYGGAVRTTSMTATGCTFTKNRANGSGNGGRGGAAYCYTSTFTGCTFTENSSTDAGGGVHSSPATELKVIGCTFTKNSAGAIGGAIHTSALASLSDCTFTENSANGYAGAIYSYSSAMSAVNCTFTGNTSRSNAGAVFAYELSATNCSFTSNNARGNGGALALYELVASNCRFTDNSTSSTGTGGHGGAIFSDSSPLVVTRCTFSGNGANSSGSSNSGGNGGAICANGSATVVAHGCTFIRNSANHTNMASSTSPRGSGGAIYSSESSIFASVISNCVLVENASSSKGTGNSSGNGGAFCFASSSSSLAPTVTNCTLLNNRHTGTTGRGHAIFVSRSLKCFNNLIWETGTAAGDQIHITPTGSLRNADTSFPSPLDLAKNLIRGGASSITAESGAVVSLGDTSVTILDANPGFVNVLNPAGADMVWGSMDDGLCPLSNSPALDQGLARYLPADSGDLDQDGNTTEVTPVDIAGRIRQQGASVDLGAYEIPPSSSYSDWVALHNLTGGDAAEEAAPGNDGVTNLTKYVLGLDPHTPARPTDGTTPGLPAMIRSGQSLRFVFLKNPEAADLTTAIQSSSSLSSWSPVTAGITETPLPGGSVKVEVLANGGTRFYRLSISR